MPIASRLSWGPWSGPVDSVCTLSPGKTAGVPPFYKIVLKQPGSCFKVKRVLSTNGSQWRDGLGKKPSRQLGSGDPVGSRVSAVAESVSVPGHAQPWACLRMGGRVKGAISAYSKKFFAGKITAAASAQWFPGSHAVRREPLLTRLPRSHRWWADTSSRFWPPRQTWRFQTARRILSERQQKTNASAPHSEVIDTVDQTQTGTGGSI